MKGLRPSAAIQVAVADRAPTSVEVVAAVPEAPGGIETRAEQYFPPSISE
jgi:hypothetical protein